MNATLKKNPLIIVLIMVSFIIHFTFLGYPKEVVFDEVHFGKFVSSYFSHQYYFDIHPPLGKLMIAGFAKISGFNAKFNFNHIGENLDAKNLFILRFLPALFGLLLPLIIYMLLKKMGLSVRGAFLGAFLTIFDNALLVQSKFILLDIFLLFFGFSALYFFLKQRDEKNNRKKWTYIVLSSILGACAFSIKWTGLLFFGIIRD